MLLYICVYMYYYRKICAIYYYRKIRFKVIVCVHKTHKIKWMYNYISNLKINPLNRKFQIFNIWINLINFALMAPDKDFGA